MASSHSEISPTQDALPYAIVSSFYGPGAWAAWCITLFSSWVPIIRGDYTHNVHFFGYALYTNWAAIDIIREYQWRARIGGAQLHEQRLAGADVYATAVAAKAVVGVGLFHSFLQYLACSSKLRKSEGTSIEEPVRKRCLAISLGQLVPSVAFWLSPLPLFAVKADKNQLEKGVARLYFSFMVIGGLLGILLRVVPMFLGIHSEDVFPNILVEPWKTSVRKTYSLWTFLVVCFQVTYWDFELIFDSSFPRRCFVVPCTSLCIREWDQAFALLGALFLFLYEFGPNIIKLVWTQSRTAAHPRSTYP
jgi:hypothetical protein